MPASITVLVKSSGTMRHKRALQAATEQQRHQRQQRTSINQNDRIQRYAIDSRFYMSSNRELHNAMSYR
jgi:hypothetical protein